MSNLSDSPSRLPSAQRAIEVTAALNKFHVVRDIRLRRLLRFYPVIVGFAVLLDWLFFNSRLLLTDPTNLTSYLSVALATIFFVRLYDQVPETLRALWDRTVLLNKARQPISTEEYTRFITAFDNRLNHPASWLFGLAAILVSSLIFIFQLGLSQFVEGIRITQLLAWLSYFIDGLGVWKLLVIALTVGRLSRNFQVSVQVMHPDQSGGLKPLGDLCVANALILLGPTMFFATTIVVGSSPDLIKLYPIFQRSAELYLFEGGLFHAMLIAMLGLAVLVFLLPLYEIHREMVRQGALHRQRLDTLTQQMDQINQEMLNLAQPFNSSDAPKRLDTLKFLRQIYDANDKVPAWPFNRSNVIKFLTSQIVPLLSLIGKPLLDVVQTVLTNLSR